MVFHDYDLNRLAGSNKLINNCTANELRNIKLLGTNSVIPSIDEVLYKINGKVPILIEIKESFHPDIEERLFEIIRSYEGEIAIQSFDKKSIIWFKNNAPFYKLGLISNNPELTVEEISKLGVDFLAFNINILDSDIVKNLKDLKFHILTWTVDTPEKYKISQKLADNCIFEKIKIN